MGDGFVCDWCVAAGGQPRLLPAPWERRPFGTETVDSTQPHWAQRAGSPTQCRPSPRPAPQDGQRPPLPSGFSAQSMCPQAGREGGCQLALLCPMPATGRGAGERGRRGIFSPLGRDRIHIHPPKLGEGAQSYSLPCRWHASPRSVRTCPLSPGAAWSPLPRHALGSTTGASRLGQGFPPGSVCLHCGHPRCLSHTPAPAPWLPQAPSWGCLPRASPGGS